MAFALVSRTKQSTPTRAKPSCKSKHPPQPSFAGKQQRLASMRSGPPVTALMTTPVIQTKLKVSEPNDKFEQEADRVADEVMRMPDSSVSGPISPAAGGDDLDAHTANGLPEIHRKCTECATEDEKLQLKPITNSTPPPRISALNGLITDHFALPNQESLIQRQEMEDEEEILQTKAAANSSPDIQPETEARVQSLRGGGQPLSVSERTFFEPRFGHDFSRVRIHTGTQAVASASAVQARAFTLGSDVVFGAGEYTPETASGRLLLAHELTHVVQQKETILGVTSPPSKLFHIQRQALPHLETDTIMTLQATLGEILGRVTNRWVPIFVPVTGHLDATTEQAIESYQIHHGLPITRTVDLATANALVTDLAAEGGHHFAIGLCVDFYDLLRGHDDVLSVHFDPTIGSVPGPNPNSDIRFEGTLRVITVGPLAFTSIADLRQAIVDQLAVAAPAVRPVVPPPNLLSSQEERRAIEYNTDKLNDTRSVIALHAVVNTPPRTIFNADIVQRIAGYQQNQGVNSKPDGKIDEATLDSIVMDMHGGGAAGNSNDSAVRIVIDYYDIDDYNALVDIFYDPSIRPAQTEARTIVLGRNMLPPGPSRMVIGPKAFRSLAALVQTLRHEMEHVRQNKVGITDTAVKEFLGEAVEIIEGPIESYETLLRDDAVRALHNWDTMSNLNPNPQNTYWNRFLSVRRIVRRTYNRAPKEIKAYFYYLMTCYNELTFPGKGLSNKCQGSLRKLMNK